MRTSISTAARIPWIVICTLPHFTMASPGVRNRLKMPQIRSRMMIDLSPRTMYENGTFESAMTPKRQIVIKQKPTGALATKIAMMKKRVATSFTRGSRRWMTESAV